VLEAAEAKQLEGYVSRTRRPATCNGRPGLEVIGSFQVTKTATTYVRRACRFYDGGHFYTLAYALPDGQAAAETTLLEAIVEATEILPDRAQAPASSVTAPSATPSAASPRVRGRNPSVIGTSPTTRR
jgi:hypothetical protein